jgi:drug/metabolite transporter (DMT)-like permease
MVALFGFVQGQIPRKEVWTGLGLCLLGLFFISGPSGGGAGFNLGDALTLLADVIWAFHMMVMGYFAVRVNTWRLVASQAGICCLVSLTVALATGTMCGFDQFVRALPFLLWGLMSVSVAYVCQAKAQINTSPTATAITLQFQPVLGAACGVVFLNEPLTWYMLTGAGLLVTGALVAQRAGDSFRLEKTHPRYELVRAARILVVLLIASACLLAILMTLP